MFVEASSYFDLSCIDNTGSSTTQKIYKNFEMGRNSTLMCKLGIDETNIATKCTFDYFKQISLGSLLVESNIEIR